MSNKRLIDAHETTAMEQAVRFVLWMQARKHAVTALTVAGAFGVSKATGYRWLNAYRKVVDDD